MRTLENPINPNWPTRLCDARSRSPSSLQRNDEWQKRIHRHSRNTRTSLADYEQFEAQFGHTDRAFCITSTSGALVFALMTLIDPGDEIIIFEPAFVMYRPLIEFLGGRCVAIDLSPTFEIDVDTVRSHTDQKLVPCC